MLELTAMYAGRELVLADQMRMEVVDRLSDAVVDGCVDRRRNLQTVMTVVVRLRIGIRVAVRRARARRSSNILSSSRSN